MNKTAIFVDGGFYRKRAATRWGHKDPKLRANELYAYCMSHIQKVRTNDVYIYSDNKQLHPKDCVGSDRQLYRIFYYDCNPLSKVVYHPYLKKNIDFEKTDTYKWTLEFFSYLKEQRKMCLRKGYLLDSDATFAIKPNRMKALLQNRITLDDLTEMDFSPSWRQKGVDMKLGIDIASLAYRRQVDQIILIAGDSDFVPAAKVARREGIDVILDPMGMSSIADSLKEHIDGVQTCWVKNNVKKNESQSAEKKSEVTEDDEIEE